MRKNKEELKQYYFVIKQLVDREIKRKYARSFLGVIWSVLNPLMTMAVMSMIFSTIFKRTIENYPIYYLTGTIFWQLFSGATNSAMTALVDNRTLLLKVKLPKQTFVLARIYTALTNFGYTCIAYVLMLVVFQIKISPTLLLFPIDVFFCLLFSMGIGYVYVYTLGEIALHVFPFVLHIELSMIEEKSDIVFGCSCAGFKIIKTQVNLGKFMPISKTFLKSYYANEEWTIQLRENVLEVWNMFGKEKLPDFENEFEEQVLNSGLICEETIDEVIKVRKEALARLAWKRNSNTQIWLVSDRYSHADDNGEAMFRFLMEHKRPDIKVFFVMDRESADYDRIAKIGPVIAQDSHEHLVMYMISDCIISSQADEYIINPFWRHGAIKDVFKDFYCRNKFVFLQHGVIKDDLSGWLNRFNKNIAGFVCAAIPEAESIHECEYYYDKQVWLTGLPRYDRLYHDEKKNILIMPTWRKWLMKNFNAADSDKDATHVIDNIEQTEFFEFYSGLLNSERLLDACEKYGYKLCYMPHTNFRECMSKFCKDERIQQFDLNMPYRQAFAEANLLVTDYSSTAMDFVYLRKPVIYAQFDKEKFFSGEHTYRKGYFDYEKDGFGEVVYELDELIDLIITYMENECNIDDKYRERVKNFFAYNDKNNCQRVYERITKLCLKQ